MKELKQRALAKKAKMKRYEQRIKQYKQNRMFNVDQKKFCQELDVKSRKEKIVPDAEDSKTFWDSLWDNVTEHNDQAKVITTIKRIYGLYHSRKSAY